jgi:hypothetical protein
MCMGELSDMEKEIKLMQVELDDTDILIRIPIDILVFAQENHSESPFIITNKPEMVEYFKKNFLTFIRGTASEDGATDFERLLDNFFEESFENGETWLDSDDSWMED